MGKPLNVQMELPWLDAVDTSEWLYFTADRFGLRLVQDNTVVAAGLSRDQARTLYERLGEFLNRG